MAGRTLTRSKRHADSVDGDAVVEAINGAATRHRLLDAAGAIFAEVGYERAGVRDICAKAHANVAAVKYHFGGKFQLYEAAISYWFEREQRESDDRTLRRPPEDAEAEFREFIRQFACRLLDVGKPAWHARLVAREMADPTDVLDGMILRTIKPTVDRLRKIIRRLVGEECPRETVERTMLSVIGQCVFYVHGRPVLERVFPNHVTPPDLDAITAHIATFSLAGIRATCSVAKPRSERKRR